jgi:hypothetical protein
MSDKPNTTKSLKVKNNGSENNNFQCQICTKNLGCKSSLNRHLKGVHESLKPFKCKLCVSTFLLGSGLNTHIRTVHQRIKPYTCEICLQTFGQKSDLKRHSDTVHKGLKPFECHFCMASFGKQYSLNTHIKTVHEKLKPFACEMCKQTFATKSLLKNTVIQSIKDWNHSSVSCTLHFLDNKATYPHTSNQSMISLSLLFVKSAYRHMGKNSFQKSHWFSS